MPPSCGYQRWTGALLRTGANGSFKNGEERLEVAVLRPMITEAEVGIPGRRRGPYTNPSGGITPLERGTARTSTPFDLLL